MSVVSSRLLRYLPTLLVLCVGIGLSAALFAMAERWEDQQSQSAFGEGADNLTSQLKNSFTTDEEVLGSIRALFEASQSVERKEFAAFVKGALSRHPHFQALEWIPFVPNTQRDSFEEEARADGYSGFQFTERDDKGNLKPAGERQAYYPVYYVEPYTGNETALGYDLGSDAIRSEVLERARDTGTSAATGRITLLQETGRQYGLLLYLPVYRNGAPHDTADERRAALAGFALAVFRVGDFVERSLGNLDTSRYYIRLYDMDAPEGERLLYESPNTNGDQRNRQQVASGPYKAVRFDVGGRQWSMLVYPKSGYLPGRDIPIALGALAGGLFMTLALAGYVSLALRQAERLARTNAALMDEISVGQRAEESLRASEAKYRDLASSIPGIVYQVLLKDGILSFPFVSEGAYAVAGVPPAEIMADATAILSRVVEEDLAILNSAIAQSAQSLETKAVEFRLRHRNGEVHWIRAIASPHPLPDGSILWNCLGLDITEQKQAERDLKDSEEKYRNIVELATDMVYVSDRDGNFSFMNDGGYLLLDACPEEVLGRPWLKWLLPEDQEPSLEKFREMIELGTDVFGFENRIISKNGTITNILHNVRVLWNENGEVVGVQGIGHDITDRKRAEAVLQESEAKLRSVTESSADAIITVDAKGNIVLWNSAATSMFGYGKDDLAGRPLSLLAEEGNRDTVSAGILRLSSPESPLASLQAVERQGVRKDGRHLPVEVSMASWEAKGERFLTFVVRDITGRKEGEKKQRSIREFIETVFDGVTDGMCVIDARDFRIVTANKTFLNTLGQSAGEVIGRRCYEATHGLSAPCQGPSTVCPLMETLRTGSVSTAEHVHYDSQGRKIYVEVSTAPLRGSDGEVYQVVHTTHDITERKRHEEQVERHVQRLSASRNIDMIITSSLDLRVTLNVLLDQVLTQLHVDAADVLLFNPETQRLEHATGKGFRTRALQHTRLRLGEGHAGRAALDLRIKSVPNLAEDPGDLVLAPLLANELFVAYFAAPLVAKGQIKGVLEIFHRSGLDPEPEWLDFLETLAGQAAIAIDNATLFQEAHRSNLELSVAYDTTLEGWVRALDMRDKETEGHTQRVTEMTVRLARYLGMGEADLVHVRRGALLHDIGKTGIPDSILLKHGAITEEEMAIMRRHPVYAYEFLSPIGFLRLALDIPYCHHERWDGTGYPRGLRAEEIPLTARIFAIVDVWDALRSDRPYRPAWPEEKVRKYVSQEGGTHFDPRVVEAFLDLLHEEDGNVIQPARLERS